MCDETTPIEVIESALLYCPDLSLTVTIDTVLVPEQCMSVFISGKQYHITVEEITE